MSIDPENCKAQTRVRILTLILLVIIGVQPLTMIQSSNLNLLQPKLAETRNALVNPASSLTLSPDEVAILESILNGGILGDDQKTAFQNRILGLTPQIASVSVATTLAPIPPGGVTSGNNVHDSAVLTGATSNAGGTVTYYWWWNGAEGSCSGPNVVSDPVTVTNGVVPNSVSYGPLSAGVYSWDAVYSGDANNGGATSPCEPLTVKNSVSITTTLAPIPPGGVVAGDNVHDSATLTGATSNAGGTVTYYWWWNGAEGSCSGPNVVSDQVTVTNGAVPNSATYGPLSAGVYSWDAVYSGDPNNGGATSPCEPLTVSAGYTFTLTSVSPSPVTLGGSITVSGTLCPAPSSGITTYVYYTEPNGQTLEDTTVHNQQDFCSSPFTVDYMQPNSVGSWSVYAQAYISSTFLATSNTITFTVNPSTVTQPVSASFNSVNGGSQQTVTVSGCSPTPSSFLGDGSTNSITMSQSCPFTLALPSGYQFTGGTGTTTCSTGTCSAYSTTYEASIGNQPIVATFNSVYGGFQQTISISGCNPSPSSFPGDGSSHTIMMSPSCSFTLSLPLGYQFTGGTGTTTCSSGTCPKYSTAYEATPVTQPITASFNSVNGGSQQTVTVSGCSPTPSSFVGDGSSHSITMSPSCSFTLSLPSGYQFIGGTGTTTCSSGTCSSFTTNYEAVPPPPSDSLSNNMVSPGTGAPYSTMFTFSVTYTDPANQAPQRSWVCIDGVCYSMTTQSSAFSTGVTYTYSTQLGAGTASYYFDFIDGRGNALNFPSQGDFVGPVVNAPPPVNTCNLPNDPNLNIVGLSIPFGGLWSIGAHLVQAKSQTSSADYRSRVLGDYGIDLNDLDFSSSSPFSVKILILFTAGTATVALGLGCNGISNMGDAISYAESIVKIMKGLDINDIKQAITSFLASPWFGAALYSLYTSGSCYTASKFASLQDITRYTATRTTSILVDLFSIVAHVIGVAVKCLVGGVITFGFACTVAAVTEIAGFIADSIDLYSQLTSTSVDQLGLGWLQGVLVYISSLDPPGSAILPQVIDANGHVVLGWDPTARVFINSSSVGTLLYSGGNYLVFVNVTGRLNFGLVLNGTVSSGSALPYFIIGSSRNANMTTIGGGFLDSNLAQVQFPLQVGQYTFSYPQMIMSVALSSTVVRKGSQLTLDVEVKALDGTIPAGLSVRGLINGVWQTLTSSGAGSYSLSIDTNQYSGSLDITLIASAPYYAQSFAYKQVTISSATSTFGSLVALLSTTTASLLILFANRKRARSRSRHVPTLG